MKSSGGTFPIRDLLNGFKDLFLRLYSISKWVLFESTVRLTAIHIHILQWSLHGELSWSLRSWSFIHCGAAPGFVSGWHHHHSLPLCELQCLSGVLLWWNVVIYFHGVPSFPLPASSTSTSLSDCQHRMPFNSPQTIGLNFLCSSAGWYV